ncbi:MAG TPA: TIR domain-containing protein [Pyrinomonadaceae bacterium]|nr:TIR domain-containing protein [Pyrinomonadaceae bacterium]
MSESKQQPKVFLSYTASDKDAAVKIAEALKKREVNVLLDVWDFMPGKSFLEEMSKSISASDYLILLLSPNSNKSDWLNYDSSLPFNKHFKSRGVTLIPVLIADTEIPQALQSYQFLDCRGDLQKEVERLAEHISVAPEIDFSRLDWKQFEDLVADLLAKLDFKNIQKHVKLNDFTFDLKADYLDSDPFGIPIKETWFAECKFYRQSRADLNTIKQFLNSLTNIAPHSHGLLVINSQLTSVANDFLERLKTELQKNIRVIDEPELKRLLIMHNDLVDKYFNEGEAQVDDSRK